jgi:tripartite-type tricarboxylate transporter receptor subunit TctC
MNCFLRASIAVAAAIWPAMGAGPAAAADWPTKTVRVIAPFSPGGSADTLGRIIAEQLSEAFGQQFFVDNKPGAGGVVGSQFAARADADGYTFVISGIASHVIAPVINGNTGYDPIKDFTHVAYLGGPPIVVIVNPSLGVTTLGELIAYGKTSGVKMTYASPGAGTNGHLVVEYFAHRVGLGVEHIPYRGAAPGVLDVVAGHLRFGAMTWTTASGQIRAGTVLPLAVSSNQRLPDQPDVPTLNELGFPELVCTTWFSLSAPAGVPADIVDKVNREVVKALARPDVKTRLAQDEMLTEPMTAAQFTRFVQAELDRWRPIAHHAGFSRTN